MPFCKPIQFSFNVLVCFPKCPSIRNLFGMHGLIISVISRKKNVTSNQHNIWVQSCWTATSESCWWHLCETNTKYLGGDMNVIQVRPVSVKLWQARNSKWREHIPLHCTVDVALRRTSQRDKITPWMSPFESLVWKFSRGSRCSFLATTFSFYQISLQLVNAWHMLRVTRVFFFFFCNVNSFEIRLLQCVRLWDLLARKKKNNCASYAPNSSSKCFGLSIGQIFSKGIQTPMKRTSGTITRGVSFFLCVSG